MKQYAQLYRQELLDNVLPFWMNFSIDKECGGFFTCLDRQGNVFDTDKFIWLQGRQVWMFAYLYNELEPRKEWLDAALHGADFLEKHAMDENGSFYFSLTRAGKPLVAPYNIFSDCFASMAFGALFKATGIEKYKTLAVDTFHHILARRNNPKGAYNKGIAGTRPLKGFSLPMILSNLSLELEHILGEEPVSKLAKEIAVEILDGFYDETTGLILENVTPEGNLSDSFEGRLVNPGHVLEAMWFLMDVGTRFNDEKLIARCIEIAYHTLEYGWDKEFGGIFYFMDRKGAPPLQLEWDQKLWWVHVEALVCMARAWQLTGDQKAADWFEKLHQYTWSRFRDPEHGEWYGYLNRRGEVLIPLKGGKWKGCFHVPRALYQVYTTLEKMEVRSPDAALV
ncbi:MAG: AGE family epimerase/isomerase [Chitinophagaceae bacterium]